MADGWLFGSLIVLLIVKLWLDAIVLKREHETARLVRENAMLLKQILAKLS